MYRGPATPTKQAGVRATFSKLAEFVKDYEPDYVIQFSPDHFNGFFYDLMPPFCVGAGAVSLGDWGGAAGPLNVCEDTALALVDHVRSVDFDVALSYRMAVDHGFVQIWEAMLGDCRTLPIIPIFVNSIAPPLPTYRRARQLGEAIGQFAMQSGKRVLFAASGGLSHDPPVPSIRGADSELRERLISGRNPTPQAKQAREQRVAEAGELAEAGKGPCQPLNPAWDAEFMSMLRRGDVSQLDALDVDIVRKDAGRGANEVLCWVAAFSALAAAGHYTITHEFYEDIPGWIAGFAAMIGVQANGAQ